MKKYLLLAVLLVAGCMCAAPRQHGDDHSFLDRLEDMAPFMIDAGESLKNSGLGIWGYIGGTALAGVGGLLGKKLEGRKTTFVQTALRAVIQGTQEAKAECAQVIGDQERTKRIFKEKIQKHTKQFKVQDFVDAEVQALKNS